MEKKNSVIEMIDKEISEHREEMRSLDEQYIQRQIRVRELLKMKSEIQQHIDYVESLNE